MNKTPTELPWKRSEVITILRHIAERDPYAEDHQSSDYCIHCYADIGNVRLALKNGASEASLHKQDCEWLLAKDMLTGIPDTESPLP